MRHIPHSVILAALTAAAVIATIHARADNNGGFANRYTVTNLTSDLPGAAANTDPVLQNSWGVAFTPGASPFWIADNATGCATLYDGQGTPQPATPLQVRIPLPPAPGTIPQTACMSVNPSNPPNPTPAAPTGVVWNPTSTFLVPGTTTAAAFIFATEDGTISAWAGGLTPPNNAVLAVDNSAVGPGAVL